MAATPQPGAAKTAAAAIDPLDLYDVRGMLTEEERLVQDSVARLVDAEVLPLIRKAFEEHRFPKELVPKLAELGLLGSSIQGYDCAGLSAVCYGLICQELERGDSGIRSFVSVQSSLCMYPIFAFGSEEQKRRYLPRMARGELIGCFGLTEPHGGSDPGQHEDPRQEARRGMGAERLEDVDHQRCDRRSRRGVGDEPGGHPRVPRGEGLARLLRA